MRTSINRRQFIGQVGAGIVAGVVAGASGGQSPAETVNVGVMGLSRGASLAEGFARLAGARVAYLCDVDQARLGKTAEAIGKLQDRAPTAVKDFRRILDDRNIDALVIAAPDHWHAPAAILACAAGKHVYVEKPVSHNPREGELMVQAARKHNRVVQVGTQRRSWPGVIEGIQKVREGAIGKVLFSRGWYTNRRGSIGKGRPAAVPPNLDWTLWQGPAPEREYRDNIVHYNWHWFWDWGTGELGNNGVHALDLCRWGLGVDYPRRVTSAGGRYYFDDDWQCPDTHAVTFDFGDKMITWEGRSCHPTGIDSLGFGASFYGDKGVLVLADPGYRLLDLAGKEQSRQGGGGGDAVHLKDFTDCIRAGRRPNADIEDGHKSTLLCHLGNIAWRVGRVLNTDPATGRIKDDEPAMKLWSREYREGWEPKV